MQPNAEPLDALLRRLQWTVLRPLARHLGGEERSRLRGPGMDLADLREYQPGDDVRRIDWNATARADRPYVREAFAERALDAWLLLDVSPSVDWGTAECLKRDRAVELAAVIGQVLGQRGNRVGALLFADRPLGFLPPGRGRTHLLHLLTALREEHQQARRAPTDLAAALKRAATFARQPSLVLVVSDFIAAAGWQDELRRLAFRHEVVAVRLHDPREASLPDVGLLTLEDPETGRQVIVDTGDKRLRTRYAAAADAQAHAIREAVQRAGASLLEISTAEPLLPVVAHFLRMRQARRGVRAGAAPTVPAAAPAPLAVRAA